MNETRLVRLVKWGAYTAAEMLLGRMPRCSTTSRYVYVGILQTLKMQCNKECHTPLIGGSRESSRRLGPISRCLELRRIRLPRFFLAAA